MPRTNSKNFTKNEIINDLNSQTGISKNYISNIIEDLIKLLCDLIVLKKINIKNFGTFELLHKNERIGRNPKTNESFKISSRKSLVFRGSKDIKKKIQDI